MIYKFWTLDVAHERLFKLHQFLIFPTLGKSCFVCLFVFKIKYYPDCFHLYSLFPSISALTTATFF